MHTWCLYPWPLTLDALQTTVLPTIALLPPFWLCCTVRTENHAPSIKHFPHCRIFRTDSVALHSTSPTPIGLQKVTSYYAAVVRALRAFCKFIQRSTFILTCKKHLRCKKADPFTSVAQSFSTASSEWWRVSYSSLCWSLLPAHIFAS